MVALPRFIFLDLTSAPDDDDENVATTFPLGSIAFAVNPINDALGVFSPLPPGKSGGNLNVWESFVDSDDCPPSSSSL